MIGGHPFRFPSLMTREASRQTSRLVDGICTAAVAFAGAFVFIPPLFHLLIGWSVIPLDSKISLVAPMVAWLIAWFIPERTARSILQVTAALAFLATPLVITDPGVYPWLPHNFSAFAVAFMAAFALPWIAALVAIMCSAGLMYLVNVSPTPEIIVTQPDLMGGLAGPLLVVFVMPSLLLLRVRWSSSAAQVDAETKKARQAAESSVLAVRAQSSRDAVDRKIHETLLNTLASISTANTLGPETVRRTCEADLERIDAMVEAHPSDLVGLVRGAVSTVELTGHRVFVHVSDNAALPDSVSNVLRDAIVEALRNVVRHARATTVTVTAMRVLSDVYVTIEDDGVGLSGNDRARFGMRNALYSSISAISGTVILHSSDRPGTTVEIRVPVNQATRPTEDMTYGLDLLLGSVLNRLAIACMTLFGIIAVPFAVQSLPNPWLNGAAYALLAAVVLALAWWWHSSARTWLAVASLACILIATAVAAASFGSCSQIVGYGWLLMIIGGCSVLPILAFTRTVTRVSLLAAYYGYVFWAYTTTPPGCAIEVANQGLSTIAYVTLAVVVLTVLTTVFDRAHAESVTAWQLSLATEASRIEQQAMNERWAQVNQETWSLMRGIVAFEVDPLDPQVQQLAVLEEARLRSLLSIAAVESAPLNASLQRALLDASQAQVAMTVNAFDLAPDAPPLLDATHSVLRSVFAAATGGHVLLTLTDQEILISASKAAIDQGLQRARSLELVAEPLEASQDQRAVLRIEESALQEDAFALHQ